VNRGFVPNKPVGKDLFAGKSHEKLAKVIANGISVRKIKTIGIEGPWGTGKSNLIELLKKN
jgi:predicted KAP-like P-loop ATPase